MDVSNGAQKTNSAVAQVEAGQFKIIAHQISNSIVYSVLYATESGDLELYQEKREEAASCTVCKERLKENTELCDIMESLLKKYPAHKSAIEKLCTITDLSVVALKIREMPDGGKF
ncbi:MAG: hypothetical protein IPL23_08055 [Saprospiraceae bacterium]|nr:hypothetical protein [Saprospiraceae bacterium]